MFNKHQIFFSIALVFISIAIIATFRTINEDPLWSSWIINYKIVIFLLLNFIIFLVFLYKKMSIKLPLIIYFFCILILHGNIYDILFFILTCIYVYFFSKGFYCVIFKLFNIKIDLWTSLLLSLIFQHHLLFCLTSLKLLSLVFYFLIVCPFTLLGAYSYLVNFKLDFLSDFSGNSYEKIIIFVLFLVLSSLFILSFSPQTFHDALVYRLSYLNELSSTKFFPDHFYLWAWITPKVFTLLAYPFYELFGELGVNWFVLINSFIFTFTLYKFCSLYSSRNITNLAISAMVISNPLIWSLAPAFYVDLIMLTFLFAGFYYFILFERKKFSYYLILSFIFFSFAISIKLNAIIFITFFCIFNFSFKLIKLINIKLLVQVLYFTFIVISPWFVYSFIITNNPVFPFFNDFMGANQLFINSAAYTEDAKKLYGFNIDLINIVKIPFLLISSTSKFGEYINGSFGFSLALSPMIFTFIFIKNKILKIDILKLLLISLSSFLLIIAFTNFFVFRYLFCAYILFLLALFLTLENNLAVKFYNIIISLICILSTFFLFSYGYKSNYWSHLGLDIYFENKTSKEFLSTINYDIPEYINSNIDKNEKIISSSFFHVNRFKNHSYLLGSNNSLFGKIYNSESFVDFVQKNNIRYWVVEPTINKFYKNNISSLEDFINNKNIVFSGGNYIVYDFKNFRGKSFLNLIHNKEKILFNYNTNIISHHELESKTKLIEIDSKFLTNKDNVTVIFDFIYFNSNKNEISRSVSSKLFNKSMHNNFVSFSSPPRNAKYITINIRPWRKDDGAIENIDLNINFY